MGGIICCGLWHGRDQRHGLCAKRGPGSSSLRKTHYSLGSGREESWRCQQVCPDMWVLEIPGRTGCTCSRPASGLPSGCLDFPALTTSPFLVCSPSSLSGSLLSSTGHRRCSGLPEIPGHHPPPQRRHVGVPGRDGNLATSSETVHHIQVTPGKVRLVQF